MRITGNKSTGKAILKGPPLTPRLLALAKPFALIANRVIIGRTGLRFPTVIMERFFSELTDSTPLHQEKWRTLGEAVKKAKKYIDDGRKVAVYIHHIRDERIVALKIIVQMPGEDGEKDLFAEFAAIEIEQLRNFNG